MRAAMTSHPCTLDALGRRLEKALADYLPKWQAWQAKHAEWHRLCEARGLTVGLDREAWELSREIGEEATGEALEPLSARINELCAEIMKTPPLGPIGVAAWVNVLAWHQGHFANWLAPPNELDVEEHSLNVFIDHMRRLAGQRPFAEPLS